MIPETVILRFLRFVQVDPVSGCWLWIGSLNNKGYGNFRLGRRVVKAHRFAYQVWGVAAGRPSLRPGDDVHHVCGVRRCCRPLHTSAVSHRVNVLVSASPVGLSWRSRRAVKELDELYRMAVHRGV